MLKIKFGNRIKQLRKDKTNLSQENFAYSIDMDRTYYSSIENGQRNVSLINIAKIACGLGVSLEELFLGIDYEGDEDVWVKKN